MVARERELLKAQKIFQQMCESIAEAGEQPD
jgi:hypothetical protein